MGVYTDADAVRSAADVEVGDLPDAAVERLIDLAEDRIDSALRGRAVDVTSGRRVVQVDVEAWQWTKLGAATARLAARFHWRPELVDDDRFASVSGPEFTTDGPMGEAMGPSVTDPLRASGLLVRSPTSVPIRRYDDRTGPNAVTQGLIE